ncbi:unnamed protein product [Effrenium voratum]|nr:unnamed protein product [Effrenium voratum]
MRIPLRHVEVCRQPAMAEVAAGGAAQGGSAQEARVPRLPSISAAGVSHAQRLSRTSLGSLLTLPADLWSADHCAAAAQQLVSLGKRYEPSVETPPRPPGQEPESPRRRLRGKQPPRRQTLVSSAPAKSEAHASVGCGKKAWKGKLAAQLQEMGFGKSRVEATLQRCRTLRQAVEWLCQG